MATCGHCHKTGQTVAHVRTCGTSAVATTERQFPTLAPGNVVTLANADGYWVVLGADESGNAEVEQSLPGDRRGANAYIRSNEVELFFSTVGAAAEYDLATRIDATQRNNRETLHGDADYCRACARGLRGRALHRTGCPAVAEMAQAATPVPTPQPTTDVWGPVTELRNAVKAHLHYETKQGTHKRMGHFAVEVEGTLKFLVIKELRSGKWAGRVFVDSMGSSTAYPVKAPATLTAYLTAVLAAPEAAAKRYADEMGQCSDCNRPLTNEESRARGIGPECWSKR